MTSFKKFQDYSKKRLNTAAHFADPKSETSHFFYASLASAQNQFAWTENATNLKGEPFRLNCGFLDAPLPNALADQFGGDHFIAIHVGLQVAINEFAMFCFAQKNFFLEIGNSAIETSPRPWNNLVPGIWLLDHTKHGEHVSQVHSQSLPPKDDQRLVGALYLGLLMARFVWLHELAHCFNGHIAMVQHRNIAMQLYELPQPLPAVGLSRQEADMTTAQSDLTLQCMELDADQSAFWASCNIQIRNLENIEGISKLDQKLRLKLSMFGAYAMTWLFAEFQT